MRLLRRNLLLIYAAYAASIVSGLVTVPLIVRAVGTEGYGVWAFIGSAVIFVSLLDLGVRPSIVRFAATYRGRGSVEETSALASVGLLIYALVALVSVPIGLGLALAVPAALGLSEDLVWPARLATLLVVGTVIAQFPLGLGTSLLLGHQRFDVVNVANIVAAAAYVGLVAGILLDHGSLVVLGSIALGTSVLRLALPLAWLPRELPGLRLRRSLITRDRLSELVDFSRHNFLIHVAGKIVFSADVIVVGAVLGATAAALYGVPAKLFGLAFGVGTAATDLLFPAFAELEGRDEEGRQRALLLRGLRLGMAPMAVLALPMIAIPDLLIAGWIGDGFAESTPVAALLGVALLLHQPAHVLSQYLVARARQRALALASLAIATANVALSIVLAYAVGIWGVALATVATGAVFVAFVMVRLVAAAGGPGAGELARAVARPLAAAAVAAVPLLVVLARVGDTDTLASLVPLGALWVVAAGLAVWRLGLAAGERRALRERFGLPGLRPDRAAPETVGY